jgi:hypothetical protein
MLVGEAKTNKLIQVINNEFLTNNITLFKIEI